MSLLRRRRAAIVAPVHLDIVAATGLLPSESGDLFELTAFLRAADLTVSGLDDPRVHLWLQVDADGRIEGCTGFELAGQNALIRSVAVAPSARGAGRGMALAQFALDRASEAGADRAWLFSRRSGTFWQKLGFEPADRDEMAELLAGTQQVSAFRQSRQLGREIAWSRRLVSAPISPVHGGGIVE